MLTTHHTGFNAYSVQSGGRIRMESEVGYVVADPEELLSMLKIHAIDLFEEE